MITKTPHTNLPFPRSPQSPLLLNLELEKLQKENEMLKQENQKLKTEITINPPNKNNIHINNNNTSSNFFLISQIEQTWNEIGENNITDCFIDYFAYPDILHEIICNIINIIQSIVSTTISSIISNFMNECNISITNQNDYTFILKKIYVIIKEYHKDVFKKENIFDTFKHAFCLFMNNHIYIKVNNNLKEQTESEIHLNSFKALYMNLLNVIVFIELSENLVLNVNEKVKDVKVFNGDTESKCICVDGLFDKKKEYLVLIPTPTTQKGFVKYCKLFPIVIAYGNKDNKGGGGNVKKKYNQQVDLKLEIEISNKHPLVVDGNYICNSNSNVKCNDNNNNINKKVNQIEMMQHTIKKNDVLTMRYLHTNYNFKVCDYLTKNAKKTNITPSHNNNNNNNNTNLIINTGLTYKSPLTKSKRVSNIKKHFSKYNTKKYLSPQTETRGNSLKSSSKTNQIVLHTNNNNNNNKLNKHSPQKLHPNTQTTTSSHNNILTTTNNKNNIAKGKHRSFLSLHYIRNNEDDFPPKKALTKIKEYIVHRITKRKHTNSGNNICNKRRKSNANSIAEHLLLNTNNQNDNNNNNKYTTTTHTTTTNNNNIITCHNNVYENERTNTSENVNHLRLNSVSPSMSKIKQCYFTSIKN